MKSHIFSVLVILPVFFLFSSLSIQISASETKPEPIELFNKLKDRIQKLDHYFVTQLQQERFGDKMGPVFKSNIKYSKGDVYLKMIAGPSKNAELIYRPGRNDGKVRVHKGSFPDITVNLSPYSSKLLVGQHHPIQHLGFHFIVNNLSDSIEKCGKAPGAKARLLEGNEARNQSSYWLEFTNPWEERQETVKKSEDLWSFAERVKADPFVILHNNQLEDPDDLSEGSTYKVPLCYTSKTIVGIDKQTHLITRLETYDKQGRLYEGYEWSALNASPNFTEKDFDSDNPEYDF